MGFGHWRFCRSATSTTHCHCIDWQMLVLVLEASAVCTEFVSYCVLVVVPDAGVNPLVFVVATSAGS